MVSGVSTRGWHLRQWQGAPYLLKHPVSSFRFLFLNRETTNFTYALKNHDELAQFLADAFGVPRPTVESYLREIANDGELLGWLRSKLRTRADRNHAPRLGRRLGWYCVARILKPQVFMETGTHDGIGTATIARALQRNQSEGVTGKVYSLDVDPGGGWAVPAPLLPFVEFVRGDIRQSLPSLLARLPAATRVGVFLHDSDHSYAHESFELDSVFPRMEPGGALLSDNSHSCEALRHFSSQRGLEFRFWKELPKGHPYPGAGIGFMRVPPGKPPKRRGDAT